MFSARRSVAIMLIGLALGAIVLWQALQPVRRQIAGRYVDRGDSYMENRDFDLALDEYAKAQDFDPSSSEASSRIALAKEGEVNIAALRSFFASHGKPDLVKEIDAATKTYSQPKDALEAGATLYTAQEFALARYPLEEAVMLDPGYPEAWNYLGLTYKELAFYDASYNAKAAQAFAKRDALTPNYLQP